MFRSAAKARRLPGEAGYAMKSLSLNLEKSNFPSDLLGFLVAMTPFFGAPEMLFAQRADERPVRHEVWDIQLGAKVADLLDDYVDYACGTNGGPPSTPLTAWKDYRRCRPDANGLREVYFRYDDELEYWAKANNLAAQIE